MLKDKILELISKSSLAYSKLDNLFLFLSTATNSKIEAVKQEFNKLIKNGDVFEVRNGKYIAVPSRGYVKGRFSGSAKGFGFCQVGEGLEDIFIPGNKTMGAIDGDLVIVKTYAQSENGQDGEVVKIYAPQERIVGTIVKLSKNYFLEPDNQKIPFKFGVRKSGIAYHDGDKVVAKILRTESFKPSCQVIEVLGESSDVKTLELAIIREHNLYEEFPEDVVSESKKIPQKVLLKQKKDRLDLTGEICFTIDGEDAKDFDDAVSIKRTKTGYMLGVHIADVGEYVKTNSKIDEEAFRRGTSTYFPTSVLPMLPTSLSNGICSLNEGVERLTLSVMIELDKSGKVLSHKIFESVIKSRARLTYTQVYKVLTGSKEKNKATPFKKELLTMLELSKILEQNAKERGALDLDIPENEFVFDENGYVIDVKKRERNDAHKLIEQFMVLANEVVAKEFKTKGLPFVYRVHESPVKSKVDSVLEFLKGLQIKAEEPPQKLTPMYFCGLLKLCEGKTFEETVNKVILRAMQKARYARECLGHFGLALEYYCHFTSPIRRYPDLTIHRFIKESLHKKITKTREEEMLDFAYESAIQSSETERNSEKAERDVDDLWKAYLLKDRVGEVFKAVITSVSSYGFYVGLENSAEGLVKVESLPLDNYLFFEKSMMLKGLKRSFIIGDCLDVKLVEANVFTRKLTFELV